MKRKYLCRLALIALLIVILIMFILNLFGRYSLKKFEKSLEEYYEQILDAYVSIYDAWIHDLEVFANKISAESKEHTSILYNGVSELDENYYHMYKVVEQLRENYDRTDVSGWGIYFYDIDKNIKPNGTSSLEHYLYGLSEDDDSCENVKNFFDKRNYAKNKKIFCTTNNDNDLRKSMLIGICTTVGKYNDEVVIYFEVLPKDVEKALIIMDGEEIEFYLKDYNTGMILLSWGSVRDEKETQQSMHNGDYEDDLGVEPKRNYNKRSNSMPLEVIAHISEGAVRHSIIEYMSNMQKIWTITLGVMIFVYVLVLWILYKPVYELSNELDITEAGEFEGIRKTIAINKSKICEQEKLIMDLLLDHLVNGVYVSPTRMHYLDVDPTTAYYCAFVLDGYVLDIGKSVALAEEIQLRFQTRVFVSDWCYENKSVYIAFMKKPNMEEVKEYFEDWLEKNNIERDCFYVGQVVTELNEIKTSLKSCFEQEKTKKGEEQRQLREAQVEKEREEAQKQLKIDILAYLDNHFCDPDLSQAKIAEKFNITNYTLSRLFKSQVGIGYAEYLVAKRLEYAKELLLTTTYTVNEISVMVGFGSFSHFLRTFKGHEGVSPSEYRRTL